MLGLDWCRWKIQNHGIDERDQSADRAAAVGQPGWLRGRSEPRSRTSCGRAIRDGDAAARRAGAVDPRPRATARRLAASRGRCLRPAGRRGVSQPAPGRASARVADAPATASRAARRASCTRAAARAVRLPSQRARRLGVSAAAWLRSLRHALATMTDADLGYGDPRGVDGAARRAGGLPRPRARRRRRARAHHRHQRLHAGPRPGLPRARRGRRANGSRWRTRATPRTR